MNDNGHTKRSHLPKLTDEQRDQIVDRYLLGESAQKMAGEFGVSYKTINVLLHKRGAMNLSTPGRRSSPTKEVSNFAHRAKSVLWRQDAGAVKKTYEAWKARVDKLSKENGGPYTKEQAIVQASKDFPCLGKLYREFDVSEHDPNPESHPQHAAGRQQPGASFAEGGGVQNEGVEQGYRENLAWALEAAGTFLRTGTKPTSCPNDTSWYLYTQAVESPKEFLQRVAQVEGKGDHESEEQRNSRKSAKRSADEIDQMLSTLDGEEWDAPT
jgi:transposase